jgi:hypothetical protein
MAARNLVRVGIKLCISFFFLMLSYVVFNTIQRYRFFIERWGQKRIEGPAMESQGTGGGDRGAISRLGVRGLSQPFRGDFVILWADIKI